MRPFFLVLFAFLQLNTIASADPVAVFSFNGPQGFRYGDFTARSYGAEPAPDRFGNPGYAVYLHGNAGSYINLGSSSALKPLRGSVSLWFNTDHIMTKGRGVESIPLVHTRSNAAEDMNEAYYVGIDLHTLTLGGCVTTSSVQQTSLYSIGATRLRKWHHLIFTYDSLKFSFFLDGAPEASSKTGFPVTFLEGDSIIAGNRVSLKNQRYFNGVIDDIMIFDRVLTPQEIQEIFNAENPVSQSFLKTHGKKVLIGLIGLVFTGILVFWRLKIVLMRERKILHTTYEQKIRVLRAQMNPHFIFNSLNSVLQLILSGSNDKAEIYLTRLAKLMRLHMETNLKDSIPLESEISLLEKYLELESLRFNQSFTWKISDDENLAAQGLHIPHSLIQPFVENAVWHGLLPKKIPGGTVSITFSRHSDHTIRCIIDDDGIGRSGAAVAKSAEGKQSHALGFVSQRLQLMSKLLKLDLPLELIDKKSREGASAGTTVKIILPVILKQHESNYN